MILGPQVIWSGVNGEMRMTWSCWRPERRHLTAGMKAMKERTLNRSAVRADRWTVGAGPCQELSDLEECRPHIPRGQIRGMSGIDKEVGYHVVGGAAIGAGGCHWPSLRNDGRTWREVAISTLLGDWDRTVSSIIWPWKMRLALFQHAPEGEGGGIGIVTSNSQLPGWLPPSGGSVPECPRCVKTPPRPRGPLHQALVVLGDYGVSQG